MSDVLVVAAHALRESLRRRVFAVVVCLTLAFGALYAWGTDELFQDVSDFGPNQVGLDPRALAGATILGLAMFGTLFLGVVLAVFLTLGAVRGDAERGLLQPLIVRPLGRRQYLAGRFLAAATVAAAYVLIVYAGAVVVTGVLGDWWPTQPVGAGVRLAAAIKRPPSSAVRPSGRTTSGCRSPRSASPRTAPSVRNTASTQPRKSVVNIARPSSVDPVSTWSSTFSAAPAASASIESKAASVPTA